MKRIKWLFSLLVLLFLPAFIFAQARIVTGTVTDTKDNSPLVDATVTVVGKSVSTKTKNDGSFTINVPSGATKLRISYVGYGDLTADITSDKLALSMTAATQSLTDVVVIGYGSARRRDLTGAVSSVKAKDFNQGVIQAPDQLLQNKVAGMEVTVNSGQPGAATTL